MELSAPSSEWSGLDRSLRRARRRRQRPASGSVPRAMRQILAGAAAALVPEPRVAQGRSYHWLAPIPASYPEAAGRPLPRQIPGGRLRLFRLLQRLPTRATTPKPVRSVLPFPPWVAEVRLCRPAGFPISSFRWSDDDVGPRLPLCSTGGPFHLRKSRSLSSHPRQEHPEPCP